MMGDKATLRLARQELEDLYLGVPDDSVDLTFRDFAFKPAATAAAGKHVPAATAGHRQSVDVDDNEPNKNSKQQSTAAPGALARSSTNIFTYRPLEDDHHGDAAAAAASGGGRGGLAGAGGGGGLPLQLPSIPASPLTLHHSDYDDDDDDDDDDYPDHHHQYHHHYPEAAAPSAAAGTTTTTTTRSAAAAAVRSSQPHSHVTIVADDAAAAAVAGHRRRSSSNHNHSKRRRPGIPHSNLCALCSRYIYVFRHHRCLVCGRVYCRRCAGDGMGDMPEGRKCTACLGRRYSHRYIHRAGDGAGGCGGGLCCFSSSSAKAALVAAQELVWAEKGPAPRRRPRHKGGYGGPSSASISASYAGAGDGGYYSSTNTVASASMSMTINSDNSIAMMRINGGGAGHGHGHGRNVNHHGMPTSASSSFVAAFPHNPHALPL